MPEQAVTPLDALRALADRAGLSLSDDELTLLLPLYDRYAAEAARLHDAPLDAEDLAVAFTPNYDEVER